METSDRDLDGVSIVVPVYNEALIIKNALERLCVDARKHLPRYEIIVVDDGSTDDTAKELKSFVRHFPKVKLIFLPTHRGKGAALRAGMGEASGTYTITLDCDLSLIKSLPLLEHVRQGATAAISSRFIQGGGHDTDLTRKIISRAFVMVRQLMVGFTDLSDTQCGCKAYRTNEIKHLLPQANVDGFCFDVELLLLLRTINAIVVEAPIQLEKVTQPRARSWSISTQSFYMFLDLYHLRIRYAKSISPSIPVDARRPLLRPTLG